MHEEKHHEKHLSDRNDERHYRIPIDCVSFGNRSVSQIDIYNFRDKPGKEQ